MRRALMGAVCGVALLAAACSGQNPVAKAPWARSRVPNRATHADRKICSRRWPPPARRQPNRECGQWMSYGRDYAEQRFSPLKASISTR